MKKWYGIAPVAMNMKVVSRRIKRYVGYTEVTFLQISRVYDRRGRGARWKRFERILIVNGGNARRMCDPNGLKRR